MSVQIGSFTLSQDPMEFYKLTATERRHAQEILDRMHETDGRQLYRYRDNGEPVLDQNQQPIPVEWVVVRMRRYILDKNGLLWRFKFKGAPKRAIDGRGQDVPFRHRAVEMWTGKWRRCINPKTGEPTYAKKTMWVPMEQNINLPATMTHLDHYRSTKGFKHPLELPESPSDFDMRVMERRHVEMANVVYAKAQALAKDPTSDERSVLAAKQAMVEMAPPKSPATRKRRKKAKKRTSRVRRVVKNHVAEEAAREAVAMEADSQDTPDNDCVETAGRTNARPPEPGEL